MEEELKRYNGYRSDGAMNRRKNITFKKIKHCKWGWKNRGFHIKEEESSKEKECWEFLLVEG